MSTSRGFRFFAGDGNWLDYGGVWARPVAPMRFHFIELVNMDEACGSDNDGQPTYSVTLSEVDLNSLLSGITDALHSCGIELPLKESISPDQVADCCRSYGLAAPLHEANTNNARRGIAECRAESYRLTRDAEAYEAAMNRPVNRIGSTAREFGRGDIQSAIVRGIDAGNPDATLVGKMYHNTGGNTLGGKINIQPITDALARR